MDRFDYAIIGAGPAGLSAAIYLGRSALKGIVFEGSVPGGKLVDINRIDNYPGNPGISGTDLALSMLKGASEAGAKFIYEKATSIDRYEDGFKVSAERGAILASYVILASGLSNQGKPLENEKRFLGKGISRCATCDGAFYRNEDVALLGNGEKPLTEALYLAGLCSKVTLLCPDDELKGSEDTVEAIKANRKIEIVYNAKPLAYVASDDGERAAAVIYEIEGEKKTLLAKAFFAYGAEEGPYSLVESLKPERKGIYLSVNPETKETTVKGLYAVGDASYSPLKQIVTATSDGALAAWAIIKEEGKKAKLP